MNKKFTNGIAEGLTKASVIAALYNAAKPQGFGFLQCTPEIMTESEAEKILETHQELGRKESFDYLNGRVMKVFIQDGEIQRLDLYNRDNGPGKAESIIESLQEARK